MGIWFKDYRSLNELNRIWSNTMEEPLGIKCEEIGADFLKISMPITDKVRQPYGFLHGGASCVLAETVGSVASALVIDREKYYGVGLEINANHLKSVKEGKVFAVARPLHLGKRTHVWDIKLFDQKDHLFCVSRLTVAILKLKAE